MANNDVSVEDEELEKFIDSFPNEDQLALRLFIKQREHEAAWQAVGNLKQFAHTAFDKNGQAHIVIDVNHIDQAIDPAIEAKKSRQFAPTTNDTTTDGGE